MPPIEESRPPSESVKETSNATFVQIITACMVGGAVLSFFSRILVVYYFGAGTVVDSYYAAYTTVTIFTEILQTGLFGILLLPVFVRYRSQGEIALAWRVASNLFNLVALGSLCLLALAFLFGESLVGWVVAGFDASGRKLTTSLFFLMLPLVTLAVLNGLATAVLHAFRRFALPAASNLMVPLFMIGALLLLVDRIGIYTLPLGMVLGAALQFALLYMGLRRLGMEHRWRIEPRQPDVRKIAIQAAPFMLAAVFVQMRVGYITNLVSHLQEGSLTALSLSAMMVFRLQDLATYGLLVVAYPLLAEQVVAGSFDAVAATLNRYFRMFAFLLFPAAVLTTVCRTPVIQLIFERGAFDPVATQLTAGALGFFAFFPFFQAGILLLRRALYSLQQTGIIVVLVLLFQGVYVGLASLLVKVMAHEGIALTLTVTTALFFAVHALYLHRRVVPLRHSLFDPGIAKMGLAALFAGALAYAVLWGTGDLAVGSELTGRLFRVVLPAGLGLIGYGTLTYLMRLPEFGRFLSLTRRWFPLEGRGEVAPAVTAPDIPKQPVVE